MHPHKRFPSPQPSVSVQRPIYPSDYRRIDCYSFVVCSGEREIGDYSGSLATTHEKMTSYIAHHTKKKQILERKESDLSRLIKSGASLDELAVAAEQVREARARVLRVKRSRVVPKGDADAIYAKIDSQIAATLAVPINDLLREFGYTVNKGGER